MSIESRSEAVAPESSGELIVQPEAPTREERRKEKLQDVIAENHAAAIEALRFEKLLSDTSEENIKMAEGIFSKFPVQARQRYEGAFHQYRRRARETNELLSRMEEEIEHEQSYGLTETDARKKLAHRIYRTLGRGWTNHTVNPAPAGTVTLDVKEGYLLLKCYEHEDYKKAAEAISGSTQAADKSAGLYGHATYVGSLKDEYRGPLLLVRADRGRADENSIIAHERQHFINHEVFGLFSQLERYPNTITDGITYPDNDIERNKVSAFARIKDEVLAYIRGGAGSDLRLSLKSDLYTHLFEKLTPDQKKEVWGIIDTTADFIAMMPSNEADNRAIIVYQLAHVPFAEFPKWLLEMREYYFSRFDLLREFDVQISASGYPMPSYWQSQILSSVLTYPDKYRKSFLELKEPARDLAQKLVSTSEEAKKAVFDQSNSRQDVDRLLGQLKEQYRSTMQEFSRIIKPITKNGILPPRAIGNPRTYLYGEEPADSRGDKSLRLAQIREILLDALDEYPQENIDLMIESSSDDARGEAKTRSRRHFEKFIKDIVHKLNDRQACSVSVFEDETIPHSLEVTIDFHMDKETKKQGVKGAELDFELHGSKLNF